MSYSHRAAAKVVTDFEKWARADEMRGSGHPAEADWIHECYLVARHRLIGRLMNDSSTHRPYMPRRPNLENYNES